MGKSSGSCIPSNFQRTFLEMQPQLRPWRSNQAKIRLKSQSCMCNDLVEHWTLTPPTTSLHPPPPAPHPLLPLPVFTKPEAAKNHVLEVGGRWESLGVRGGLCMFTFFPRCHGRLCRSNTPQQRRKGEREVCKAKILHCQH